MLKLETGTFLGDIRKTFDADGILICQTEYKDKVFEGWHSHENHHISFILEGGNREERRHREIQANPGSLVFYSAGELHRNLNTLHPSRNLNLEIEESFYRSYNLSDLVVNEQSLNIAEVKFTLLKIYKECLSNDSHSTSSIHASLLSLLQHRNTEIDETSPRWVKAIREILNDRWNEAPTLSELSKVLQVHPVTVSKHFPKYFNCTFGEYMRKLKVEKAIEQIKSSGRPLTEVAYACGFFDQSHFIRAFKTLTSLSPKEYRKF
jgi:AraC family transcriptional regulator